MGRCAVAIALAAFTVAACSRDEPKRPEGTRALVMTPGEDLSASALEILNRKCTSCHAAERFAGRDFTPEEWKSVIERMVGRGAPLSGEEQEVLRRWREVK